MALVLIRLGCSGFAIYKEHLGLFQLVLTHSGSESCTVYFLRFLFIKNILVKFENFSQLVQQVLLGSLGFRNASDCFSWFSLVRA